MQISMDTSPFRGLIAKAMVIRVHNGGNYIFINNWPGFPVRVILLQDFCFSHFFWYNLLLMRKMSCAEEILIASFYIHHTKRTLWKLGVTF